MADKYIVSDVSIYNRKTESYIVHSVKCK